MNESLWGKPENRLQNYFTVNSKATKSEWINMGIHEHKRKERRCVSRKAWGLETNIVPEARSICDQNPGLWEASIWTSLSWCHWGHMRPADVPRWWHLFGPVTLFLIPSSHSTYITPCLMIRIFINPYSLKDSWTQEETVGAWCARLTKVGSDGTSSRSPLPPGPCCNSHPVFFSQTGYSWI